jgi:hypothetical protein
MKRNELTPDPIERSDAIRRHMGTALDALIVTLLAMANPVPQGPVLQPVPVPVRRRRRQLPLK